MENVIKELEAYRDDLLNQAVRVDVMIDDLRNGTTIPAAVKKAPYARAGRNTPEILGAVLESIRENPGITNRQIARRLHLADSTASRATRELRDTSKIEKVGTQRRSFMWRVAEGQ